MGLSTPYDPLDVLSSFKKAWEDFPPIDPLTADTSNVFRPEILDFVDIVSPDFFKVVKTRQHVREDVQRLSVRVDVTAKDTVTVRR